MRKQISLHLALLTTNLQNNWTDTNVKISTVYKYIDAIAPFETQMSFDNAGLLVGNADGDFENALLALDITPAVISEAVEKNCQLIISHHPVIFQPIKKCLSDSIVYQLAQNGLTAICAHTNFDMAVGGVNDVICSLLGIHTAEVAQASAEFRIGMLSQAVCAKDFAKTIAEKLHTSVRLTNHDNLVSKVAVCGGSGGDYYEEAFEAGAQMLITGEAKHHELLAAQALGFSLAVAGHFETETVAMPALAEKLRVIFPQNHFIVSEQVNPVITVM